MVPIIVGMLLVGLLSGSPAPAPVEVETEIEQQIEEVEIELEPTLVSMPNITTATELLAALPERETKIPVAVYNVADKTGQYKADGGASSTVVTQGATEMLITALKRSGQFAVLDRVRFQDIMNEQNLVTSQRIADGYGPQIGVLIGADYIISGAITEYQVDRSTGGVGLRIAGIGGSKEFARATCALDLRVTDVSTGEVVWSESLYGEILGEKVGIEIFRFFGKSLVEFETGKGMQEVINLVVRTLIEEAVYKMNQSGVFEG